MLNFGWMMAVKERKGKDISFNWYKISEIRMRNNCTRKTWKIFIRIPGWKRYKRVRIYQHSKNLNIIQNAATASPITQRGRPGHCCSS